MTNQGLGRYTPFGLLNLALDHIRLLVIVPLLAMVIAVAFSLVRGPEFAAQSTFMTETDQPTLSQLGGLAAQLDLGTGLLSQGESVDFYATLAASRATLEELATREYRFPVTDGAADTLHGTAAQLLRVEGETPGERLRATIATLKDLVQATPDRGAGVVVVSTRAPWPGLAVQLNRGVLEAVNQFNLKKRQTRAAAERRFVEQQIEDTQKELDAAEGDLETFLEQNRRYEEWPQLRFHEQRLERRVELLQQLHTSLAQSVQKARIDEVRTTPVVTLVAPPETSVEKTTSLVRTAVLGLLLGLVLVLSALFMREFLTRERERAPLEYGRFRQRSRRLVRR